MSLLTCLWQGLLLTVPGCLEPVIGLVDTGASHTAGSSNAEKVFQMSLNLQKVFVFLRFFYSLSLCKTLSSGPEPTSCIRPGLASAPQSLALQSLGSAELTDLRCHTAGIRSHWRDTIKTLSINCFYNFMLFKNMRETHTFFILSL